MSSSVTLAKGQNIAASEAFGLHSPQLRIVLRSNESVPTDTSVILVGANGRVQANEDFVFYNQPSAVDGAVRLATATDGTESGFDEVYLELGSIPTHIDRLIIAASVDPDAAADVTFARLDAVHMEVTAPGADVPSRLDSAIDGFADERALIFGEVYRRESGWKIRAVGQGYSAGLAALATDFGIEVDDGGGADGQGEPIESVVSPDSSDPHAAEVREQLQVPPGPQQAATEAEAIEPAPSEPIVRGKNRSGVALGRRKSPAKLPADWRGRVSPGIPLQESAEQWPRARLFPSVGIKTSADQEGRATAVLLAVMELVPEFGRRMATSLGAPRGRIETFTEVRFSHAGQELRPDGLIRVTRGTTNWIALVEVKTAKGQLGVEQVDAYTKLARAKGFDAVVTVSCELMSNAAETPIAIDARQRKSVNLVHRSWEEMITEAAMVITGKEVSDSTRVRVLEEFLLYAADQQSGMWSFTDMGRHWVKVRNAVSDATLGAGDSATADICVRFDQLNRHVALQLTALTGTVVTSQAPANRADTVSRAKQLADSGELFGTLRVPGATGPLVTNANLARGRISCSQRVTAPKSGRTLTKINWLVRQLEDAPEKVRVTAHHLGSRTDATSALLDQARADPESLLPPGGKDIREFTVALDATMGSKRAATENGFVTTMVTLVNTFYELVTQPLRLPRD